MFYLIAFDKDGEKYYAHTDWDENGMGFSKGIFKYTIVFDEIRNIDYIKEKFKDRFPEMYFEANYSAL